MKRVIILITIFTISASLFAQPKLLAPVDPAIMGRGFTAVADPGGYQAFFHNPAGFAKEDQFTLLSLNPWIFTDKDTIEILQNPKATADNLETQFTDSAENPDIEAEIQAWFDKKTTEELAAILNDAGYTQQDIYEAGGVDAFFASLTQEELISLAGIVLEDPTFPVDKEKLNLPSGAARVGTSAGIAFTSGGFAIGAFGIVDAQLEGPNILAAEGRATAQITLHAGYAHTFDLNLIKLRTGLQVRPTILYNVNVDSSFLPEIMNGGAQIVDYLLNKEGVASFGLGVDAGVIVDIWWFNFGVSAMNLLSYMNEQPASLNDIKDNPSMLFPETEPAFKENLALNFGVGFHPQFGPLSALLDPAIYVDFQDINGVIEAAGAGDDKALLDMIKIGADVKLLSFLRAKAGFADGYFTLGAGLDLPLINVSVAANFGALQVDDISDFGVTAEVAFRF